jgi:hypothetical protein
MPPSDYQQIGNEPASGQREQALVIACISQSPENKAL